MGRPSGIGRTSASLRPRLGDVREPAVEGGE
jgi:hypothetical protein